MNTFFASSWARRFTLLVSSLLLTLLLMTTFLPSTSVHAAPPPPAPTPGDTTATADVQGIPGVTQMTEYVYPEFGEAQVNLQDAQGQDVEQDYVYFTPTNGSSPQDPRVTPRP